MSHDLETMSFDIAVVCALPIELKQVCKTGADAWTELPPRNDYPEPVTYWATTYGRPNGKLLRVVAATPRQMGMPASAILTTKMALRFRPSLIAHVGIAAGVEGGGRNFGDILAPDHTFDYGAGKISSAGERKLEFSPDPRPIDIYPLLHERLQFWKEHRHSELERIRTNWDGISPNTSLKLHIGPLGSGAAVVARKRTVEQIRDHWRKLIGLEMEAYGVHLACQDVVHPPAMFLCMKSVCDFADVRKDDDWQPYAAYTAAQLFHSFVTNEWDRLFPNQTHLSNVVLGDVPSSPTLVTPPATVSLPLPIAEQRPLRNPFHPGGSLPVGHQTYVERVCDDDLDAALQVSPLITIEGQSSTGKSSLVLKFRASLVKTHRVCYLDLQDSRNDDETAFMQFFFEEIGEQLSRKMSNWSHIDDGSEQPCALIIDEIGFLNTRIAKNFIPQLVHYATQRRKNARVIVCLPVHRASDSIHLFLKSLGISHAKYNSGWRRIRTGPFTELQVNKLLALLSTRVQDVALEQVSIIATLSNGNPKAIQCLCSRLWDADSGNATVSELRVMIQTRGAYE